MDQPTSAPPLDDVTTHDYLMVMKKVRIADLKAHLSAHLKEVRRGHVVVVMDRDTPIARIVPYDPLAEPLVIRKGRGRLRDVPLPPPASIDFDIVDELLADRKERNF